MGTFLNCNHLNNSIFTISIFDIAYASQEGSYTNLPEVVTMKKILSTIVAVLVALSFSAVVFAADTATATKAATQKKTVKKPVKYKTVTKTDRKVRTIIPANQ